MLAICSYAIKYNCFILLLIPNETQVDIRVRTANGVVCIRYGGSAEIERQNLLQRWFLQAAVQKWNQVRKHLLVNSNLQTQSKESTIDEQRLILTGQSVLGYMAHAFHDLKTYPELADDPQNVIFIKI